jgi:hypothetical protein
MMRIRFLDVVFDFASLLVEEVLEVAGRERNDVGGVFLDNCF